MTIAGVDEAGRGCVIGPLVIAGVMFDDDVVGALREIGVKDSKKLSAKKRVKLSVEIKELALGYRFFELSPRTIDKVVFRNVPLRRLNYLETMGMACIIRELKPDEAHIDPCDVVSERVASQIKGVLPFDLVIRCEPRADAKYPATSAASILAKVRRDSHIEELRELHGDFNSGYPSDWRTQNFLRDYFSENKECPDYMRESWSTVQKYMRSE
ncbi:ribonuclease HII [Candidatus Bathyarchaeota archaeon]|jgi:ribonuclease HII|nr:ribonuclease HII [Candidatus Bathyarchaeota archaeon]MBT7346908.1 ribonuclease HII [Candidatus Bathyarchaeota archaeon]